LHERLQLSWISRNGGQLGAIQGACEAEEITDEGERELPVLGHR
jgi:hypothetical protein